MFNNWIQRWLPLFALLVVAGCATAPTHNLEEGGLYSIQQENGEYRIIKVLKIDSKAVHVRMYSNRFFEPITELNPEELVLKGMSRTDEEKKMYDVGLGHIPIDPSDGFDDAEFIMKTEVRDEELDGYRLWRDQS